MKNIRIYSLVLGCFFALLSCTDDGGIMDEAPGETLRGTLTDSQTGENYLTDDNGFQFVLKEISYGDNAPERVYPGMFEGTYQNTKLFDAEYSLELRGAFPPVAIENVKVSGTVVKDFTVTPFTNFIGVSASRSGTNVTVKYTLSRTTTAGGDVNDIRVYFSRYLRTGPDVFENQEIIRPNSAESDAIYDGAEQTVVISDDDIDPSVQYYVRIATRTTGSLFRNFSEVVEVN